MRPVLWIVAGVACELAMLVVLTVAPHPQPRHRDARQRRQERQEVEQAAGHSSPMLRQPASEACAPGATEGDGQCQVCNTVAGGPVGMYPAHPESRCLTASICNAAQHFIFSG